jgi:drug/metabolite transporter (DMT)-like permease
VNDRRRLAVIAMAILALLWGYNWVVMKIAVHYTSPFDFAAWRTLGGGIVLALAGIVTRRRLRPQKPVAYFWIGFFQTAAFVGLVTWAVVTAGAGQVAMLAYTMPFWVALLAWPALGERLRFGQLVAIVIAFVGVACMVGKLHGLLADSLAVLAGLSWAIGTVIAKRVQRGGGIDLFGMTMWQMLFAGAVLTLVALLTPSHPTIWSPTYIAAVAYSAILATAVGYLLWLFVLDVLPARDASMGTLANPLIGVVGAWIQLGERPTLVEGIGMILVVIGLATLTLTDRKTPSKPA